MTHFAYHAIDVAKSLGASYADARVVDQAEENLSVKDQKVVGNHRSESRGIGIRVLAKGAWGFAATHLLTRASVERTVAHAISLAKASAAVQIHPVRLAPSQPQKISWRHPVLVDPFTVSIQSKIGHLLDVTRAVKEIKHVTFAHASMNFKRTHQWMVSTDGHDIDQIIVRSGAGCSAEAVRQGEVQVRSYPNSFGGQFETRGYELIDRLDLLGHAPQIGEEAVALLDAPTCPRGKKDLIIGSSQLALQIHESCGHPIELDRVLGEEAGFMGTSFLTPDQRGTLRYGSSLVTITADAMIEGGLGTFGFDDEGTPAQTWDIVKNGTFVGYLTSRETAPKIGENASWGCVRAQSWNFLPMIRMVNISLKPGSGTLKDVISDTKDGIYVEGTRSWSIDQKRLNFHFANEVGWEINNGKIIRMVKYPRYHGSTPEFWNSCDAICGPEEWRLWGVPNCGKGEPIQIAEVSHGASPARFRQVNVGG